MIRLYYRIKHWFTGCEPDQLLDAGPGAVYCPDCRRGYLI